MQGFSANKHLNGDEKRKVFLMEVANTSLSFNIIRQDACHGWKNHEGTRQAENVSSWCEQQASRYHPKKSDRHALQLLVQHLDESVNRRSRRVIKIVVAFISELDPYEMKWLSRRRPRR